MKYSIEKHGRKRVMSHEELIERLVNPEEDSEAANEAADLIRELTTSPLPDEVAKIVSELRHDNIPLEDDAADLIERLARGKKELAKIVQKDTLRLGEAQARIEELEKQQDYLEIPLFLRDPKNAESEVAKLVTRLTEQVRMLIQELKRIKTTTGCVATECEIGEFLKKMDGVT